MKVEVDDLVRCDCGVKCGIKGRVLRVTDDFCLIWDYKKERTETVSKSVAVIEVKASKLSKALE